MQEAQSVDFFYNGDEALTRIMISPSLIFGPCLTWYLGFSGLKEERGGSNRHASSIDLFTLS